MGYANILMAVVLSYIIHTMNVTGDAVLHPILYGFQIAGLIMNIICAVLSLVGRE